MGAGDPDLLVPRLHDHNRPRLDPKRPATGQDLDPVGEQLAAHHLGGLWILPAQDVVGFDDDDLGPEPAEGLSKLDPDGAPTQDDQALRQGGEFEDGLIGQVGRGVQSRDGGNGGPGARGDDELAGGDAEAVAGDGAGVQEVGRLADHMDAEALETLLAVDRGDGPDGLEDVGHDPGEVDLDRAGGDAEAPSAARRMGCGGGGDQGLGGHAAIVEAVAPHLALFEKDDLQAQLGGARGDGKAAGPGSDDGNVYLKGLGHRVFPERARRRWKIVAPRVRRPSATRGRKTLGEKMTPRSGVPPRERISPIPAPIPL